MSDAPLENLTFMIVDDNRHMRLLVGKLLRSFGAAKVVNARDGAEAIDILRHTATDIVVADYQMEPMNGVEFTRRIRDGVDGIDPTLAIVMMSGHSERYRVERARDAGVNEYLAKPVTAQSLYDHVAQIVNNPRAFIRSPDYSGPDRRRRDAPGYRGPRRRWTDQVDAEIEDVRL